MRLTAFTDFALRALMRLAAEPDRSFSTNEIATEFGISRNHLIKVVGDLANGGFVSTQRGIGGGFLSRSRLAKSYERSRAGTRWSNAFETMAGTACSSHAADLRHGWPPHERHSCENSTPPRWRSALTPGDQKAG